MESTYSFSSFAGVGVVEAQVGLAAELGGEAEVQADRLGVADVQIAVGLGRKARMHAAAELVGLQIVEDDVADEVRGRAAGRAVLRIYGSPYCFNFSMAWSMRAGEASRPKYFQGAKQRRRGLAAAYGDADGLEHLAGFDAQSARGGAQGRFEPIVGEFGGRQRFAASFEHAQRQGGIAFLGDQLGAVVRREVGRRRRNRPPSGRRSAA